MHNIVKLGEDLCWL